MSDPISSIRNLGPVFEAHCARIGITTAEEVREMGADAIYSRLLAAGLRPHFIGYYALTMGLQGRPWNDCKGAEKDALRARFDQIKAKGTNPIEDAFERMMDQIGVRAPDRSVREPKG